MSPIRMRSGQPVSATDSNAMETPKNTLVFFILLLRTVRMSVVGRNGRGRTNQISRPPSPTSSLRTKTGQRMPGKKSGVWSRESGVSPPTPDSRLQTPDSRLQTSCIIFVVINVEILTIGNEILLGLVQ